MYHSRILLSVGGSVWYMIWNLCCTVTIDSVLANSKTQNAFLFTVNVIFLHDYPLAVEPGSTPRPLVQKKVGEILYLYAPFCHVCLSCCAVEFGNPGGTYEEPCIWLDEQINQTKPNRAWSILCINKSICMCLWKQGFITINECICK